MTSPTERRIAHHMTALRDAGFVEEPPPDMILLRAERRPTSPELTELGLVRVRYQLRSGGWSYDTVPIEAIVDAASN